MNKHEIIETLQKDVEIPMIVRLKAEEAFEKIQRESKKEEQQTVSLPRQKKARRFLGKRAAIVAIAASLGLLTVTAGAAVYERWSKSLSEGLQATEEQMQELEESNMTTFVQQSCTDAEITVTAVQSITDNYYTYLAFKVEGYDLPESAEPCFDKITVEVDGRDDFNWGASFYDGLITDSDGSIANADGNPANGMYGSYVMEDGSMEYRIVLAKSDEDGFFIGKPIHVELENLGTVAKAEFFPDIEGTWSFDWDLQGADCATSYEVEAVLGDTGATVTKLSLSPISLQAEYVFPQRIITAQGEDSDGNPITYTEYAEPPRLTGVKLKDGTLLPFVYGGPGSAGYEADDSDIYQISYATDRVIDTEQVEAFLFLKNTHDEIGDYTEEDFYVVPLE